MEKFEIFKLKEAGLSNEQVLRILAYCKEGQFYPSLEEIARIAHAANEKMEDIGARRLHTVIERVIEDISFEASEKSGEKINVTKELVKERLKDVVEDQDLARYIL